MKNISHYTLLTLLLLSFIIADVTHARPIVADLAIRSVDIDHDFTGIDILMFGARNDVGRIVVVVRGPKKRYIVRKKERIAGIWMNVKSMEFDNVNGFYSIASTNPLINIKNENLLDSLDIGINKLSFEGSKQDKDFKAFERALIRNKQKDGLFIGKITPIDFWDETLFRTTLTFPKNIARGWYTAEVYLFNDGLLTAVQSTPIEVSKIGFEAFMSDLAHSHQIIYGILCIVLALIAGWTASTLLGRR